MTSGPADAAAEGEEPPTADTPPPADTADADTSPADTSPADTSPVDPETPVPETPDPDETPVEPGEVLFYEPGGSWWVVSIGPVLVAAVLIMEITGPGQVHWAVITIFALILIGFSVVQVYAARRHVSVELTDTTLRQGTRTLALADIATVFPENTGSEHEKWESAPALGELHGVPRRRKGVGVKLSDGSLAQAWARDVDRFRRELTDAHLAVKLGLPPRDAD